MELITGVAAWISTHWLEIGVAAGYIVAAARIIVKLIPGDTDNEVLKKIESILRKIGLHLD